MAVALGAVSAHASELPGPPSVGQLPQPHLPQIAPPVVPSLPSSPVPQSSMPSLSGGVQRIPESGGLGDLASAPTGHSPGGGGGVATGARAATSFGAGTAGGRGVAAAAAGGGTSPAAHAALSPAVRQRLRAHERRIRRAVRQLRGCFYALSRFQRRVLALRGGLEERPPMSRAAVAARLHTTRTRVRRAERRGLQRLRKAEQSDNCTGHGARRTGPAIAAAGHALLAALKEDPRGESGFGATVADKPRHGVRGMHASSEDGRDNTRQQSQQPERLGLALPESESSIAVGPLIFLLLSIIAISILFREWRRSA